MSTPFNEITATGVIMIRQAQVEMATELLRRCLKAAKSGNWRDRAGFSIEGHPLWDEVREFVSQQERP